MQRAARPLSAGTPREPLPPAGGPKATPAREIHSARAVPSAALGAECGPSPPPSPPRTFPRRFRHLGDPPEEVDVPPPPPNHTQLLAFEVVRSLLIDEGCGRGLLKDDETDEFRTIWSTFSLHRRVLLGLGPMRRALTRWSRIWRAKRRVRQLRWERAHDLEAMDRRQLGNEWVLGFTKAALPAVVHQEEMERESILRRCFLHRYALARVRVGIDVSCSLRTILFGQWSPPTEKGAPYWRRPSLPPPPAPPPDPATAEWPGFLFGKIVMFEQLARDALIDEAWTGWVAITTRLKLRHTSHDERENRKQLVADRDREVRQKYNTFRAVTFTAERREVEQDEHAARELLTRDSADTLYAVATTFAVMGTLPWMAQM